MRALVTGGTGFIGSHLVEALLRRGYEVRCLVREPGRPGWLDGLDVELVKGDCTVPSSLGGIAADVDYIFHTAGLTKAAKARQYYEINGEGARFMAEAAARDAGRLRKFVLVSSQAASGPSEEGRPRREEDPPAPVSDYGKSKLLGERHALKLKDRIDLVIVRPPSVYGPRDRDVYTLFRLISRGVRTAFSKRREISLCYVEDLVEGMVLAAESATTSGDAFFVAEERPYTWDEIGGHIAAALGVRPKKVTVPVPAMYIVALFAEAAAAVAGKPALLNRQKMAEIRQRFWVLDVGKAASRLGFRARHPFPEGAKATADWYRRQGWV